MFEYFIFDDFHFKFIQSLRLIMIYWKHCSIYTSHFSTLSQFTTWKHIKQTMYWCELFNYQYVMIGWNSWPFLKLSNNCKQQDTIYSTIATFEWYHMIYFNSSMYNHENYVIFQ
jgi:hypothetical protein